MKSYNLIFLSLFAFAAVTPCHYALGALQTCTIITCPDSDYDPTPYGEDVIPQQWTYKGTIAISDMHNCTKVEEVCVQVGSKGYYRVQKCGACPGTSGVFDMQTIPELGCPMEVLICEDDEPDECAQAGGQADGLEELANMTYCEVWGRTYYYKNAGTGYKVTDCVRCKSNAEFFSQSYSIPRTGCTTESVGGCRYTCGTDNCKSDTDWTNYTDYSMPGYQKRTDRSCGNNKCIETTRYRCAPRYCASVDDSSGVTTIENLHCTSYDDINLQWGNWASYETGYQRREGTKMCRGAVIADETRYEYQCAADYYGSAAGDGLSGCEPCGKMDGVPFTSPDAGNGKLRSSCCVSHGSYSDGTGDYEIIADGCCLED